MRGKFEDKNEKGLEGNRRAHGVARMPPEGPPRDFEYDEEAND